MSLRSHIRALSLVFARRLRFPDAHDPQWQGLACSVGASLGSQQLHAAPTELDLGASGPSFMFAGHINAPVRLGGPGLGPIQQMIQFGFGLLLLAHHASILGGAHQEVGAHLPTAVQKGKHIRVAVGHMDPHLSLWWRAHPLDGSRPHITFPRPLAALAGALFAAISLAWSLLAHPGLLIEQSQYALTPAAGDHRQHGMHEEAAMAAIANWS